MEYVNVCASVDTNKISEKIMRHLDVPFPTSPLIRNFDIFLRQKKSFRIFIASTFNSVFFFLYNFYKNIYNYFYFSFKNLSLKYEIK